MFPSSLTEQEAIAEFLDSMPMINEEFDICYKIGEGEACTNPYHPAPSTHTHTHRHVQLCVSGVSQGYTRKEGGYQAPRTHLLTQ